MGMRIDLSGCVGLEDAAIDALVSVPLVSCTRLVLDSLEVTGRGLVDLPRTSRGSATSRSRAAPSSPPTRSGRSGAPALRCSR